MVRPDMEEGDSMKEAVQPQQDSFLSWLMFQQWIFEGERQGVDGSLLERNGPERCIKGVIGEAEECLTEVENSNIDEAREEAVDMLIFISTLFNHLGMSPEEVMTIAYKKVMQTKKKYDVTVFEGRTVEEAMKVNKYRWTMQKEAVAAD